MAQNFTITLPSGGVATGRVPGLADLERLGNTRVGCGDQDRWAVSLVQTIDNSPPDFDSMDAADTATIALVVSDFLPDQDEIAHAIESRETHPSGQAFTVEHEGAAVEVVFTRPTNAHVLQSKQHGKGIMWAENAQLMRLCLRSVDGKAKSYQDMRLAWPFDLRTSVVLVECVQSLKLPSIAAVEAAKGSLRVT